MSTKPIQLSQYLSPDRVQIVQQHTDQLRKGANFTWNGTIYNIKMVEARRNSEDVLIFRAYSCSEISTQIFSGQNDKVKFPKCEKPKTFISIFPIIKGGTICNAQVPAFGGKLNKDQKELYQTFSLMPKVESKWTVEQIGAVIAVIAFLALTTLGLWKYTSASSNQ